MYLYFKICVTVNTHVRICTCRVSACVVREYACACACAVKISRYNEVNILFVLTVAKIFF